VLNWVLTLNRHELLGLARANRSLYVRKAVVGAVRFVHPPEERKDGRMEQVPVVHVLKKAEREAPKDCSNNNPTWLANFCRKRLGGKPPNSAQSNRKLQDGRKSEER